MTTIVGSLIFPGENDPDYKIYQERLLKKTVREKVRSMKDMLSLFIEPMQDLQIGTRNINDEIIDYDLAEIEKAVDRIEESLNDLESTFSD